MASSLKVNRVVPSTGTNIGIGTASGEIRLASTSKLTWDGDTNTYINHPSADTITARTAGSERLRITSDGKVGISEDDPQAQLHINSGANSAIMFGNTTNGYKIRANVTGSNDYGLLIEDEDGVDLYRAVSSTGTSNANTHTFFGTGGEEIVRFNSSSTELLRISGPVNSSSQQEFGIGIAVNDAHTHPAAKITFKEYDASDSRGSLLFYTRGANSDSAPTERLHIDENGYIAISHNQQTPSHRLHVTDNSATNATVVFDNPHTSATLSGNTASNGFSHALVLENSNVTVGNLASLGFQCRTSTAYCNAAITAKSTNANGSADLIFWTENANTIGEKLRITSAGYIKTPSQPVFMAYRTSNYNITTTATAMVYDEEEIDVGGNYNPSNGRFTAPVDGLYEFGYASIASNTATVYRYDLRISGSIPYGGMRQELRLDQSNNSTQYGTNGEFCLYINMTAGQYAQVYVHADTNVNGAYGDTQYGYTYFRGRLVG